jgi:CBS domain-containing protein
MLSARISELPVVGDTRLIGIVTETDLLRILSDALRKGEA